jgi:hypothetical protein
MEIFPQCGKFSTMWKFFHNVENFPQLWKVFHNVERFPQLWKTVIFPSQKPQGKNPHQSTHKTNSFIIDRKIKLLEAAETIPGILP